MHAGAILEDSITLETETVSPDSLAQEYLSRRYALISRATPCIAAARRLAALTDELLIRLVGACPVQPKERWALVSLGGYGYGALLPSSDIDLLVLSQGTASALKPFVESLLYPLWDAGLTVGHQVRSPRAHRALAKDDETVFTATLTARVICGDTEYGQTLIDRCRADARKRARRVLSAFAKRPRPGSPYLLEPDLKDGAGGRRDYDELVWTAAVLEDARPTTLVSLVDAGFLAQWELELVEAAAEVTAAARWQLGANGKGPKLTPDAAAALDEEAAQALQTSLADTAHILERVRRRVAGVTGASSDGSVPAEGTTLPPDEVYGLLRAGDDGVHRLEEEAWLGKLDGLAPGFRTLLPLRRPALGHEFTVGAHSLRCASLAASVSADDPSALGRSRSSIDDDRPLLVAALVHDAAKSSPGAGHAERGAAPAAESARRFGLDVCGRSDVAELVRLHLVLAESAQHLDLDSEDAILSVAEKIGARELVAPLHVLTVADGLSTGPGAWTDWHDALVSKLVSRVWQALSPEIDGAGMAAIGERVRASTLAALGTDAEEAAIRFVKRAPLRYLASRGAEQVAAHARLVAQLDSDPASSGARLAVHPGPLAATYEAAVVAHDRPGLFASLAGVLALAGLDILAADAFSTTEGTALDVFTVRSATLAPVGPETWQKVERYLRGVLRDRLKLETRLAERRRHYPDPRRRVRTRVITDSSAGYDTAISVTATDRVGVLYDIAKAIASLGLDIRWAKVLTTDGIARDTFYVVGPDGQAPTDNGILGHVAMRIREAT